VSFTYVLPDTSLTGPYARWGLPRTPRPAQFGRGRWAINIIDTKKPTLTFITPHSRKLNVVIAPGHARLQDNVGVKAVTFSREVRRGNPSLGTADTSRAMQP